jgi:hypothetical protein
MSNRPKRGGNFEERLLTRLKAVVAERGAAGAGAGHGPQFDESPGPRRRRPPRLALAGLAALAIAVVVLIVSSGGDSTSRAFAVEPLQGGGVAIKVYSLEEDTDKLEEALAKEGIPSQISWLEAQTTCAERHLNPASVNTAMGGRTTGGVMMGGKGPALTIGILTAEQYRKISRAFMKEIREGHESTISMPNLTFEPHSFAPNQTLVIVGSPEPHGGDPEGGFRVSVETVEGPVPPCEVIPEAAGSIGAIQLPEGAEGNPAAAAVPEPGQFLYTKTEVVQVQDWEPNGRGTGPKDHPRHFTSRLAGANGHTALVPTTKESWTGHNGKSHVRETMGQIEFLDPADQKLWEEAGSPPPFEFDPAEHHVTEDGEGNPVKEYSGRTFKGKHTFSDVPKLFALPTEAEALRLAIEGQEAGSPPASVKTDNGRSTAERLFEILAEPAATAALRAAAFEALGELPGIKREANATDPTGRQGEGLRLEDETGFGREVIFDRHTSQTLSEAEMVFGQPSTHTYGLPPNTIFRGTAYLQSRIVDSEP